MFAKERQSKIYGLVKRKGAVTTAELMEAFSVSIETIRRDLLVLEQSRMLQRVHGGAVAVGEAKQFQTLAGRKEENERQKRELVRTAAQLVREGDTIGIDSGSTAILFAEAVRERFSCLTVATYSLDVFEILCRHKQFQVMLCGGYLYKEENSFYGCFAVEMLKKIHLQKVFLFPLAVSLQYGICDYQKELYPMQRQLIDSGDPVYVLADSSKFGKNSLLKLGDMNPGYIYITDSGLPDELSKLYRENHIKIITGKEDAE